jgi:hypothetical protein
MFAGVCHCVSNAPPFTEIGTEHGQKAASKHFGDNDFILLDTGRVKGAQMQIKIV